MVRVDQLGEPFSFGGLLWLEGGLSLKSLYIEGFILMWHVEVKVLRAGAYRGHQITTPPTEGTG